MLRKLTTMLLTSSQIDRRKSRKFSQLDRRPRQKQAYKNEIRIQNKLNFPPPRRPHFLLLPSHHHSLQVQGKQCGTCAVSLPTDLERQGEKAEPVAPWSCASSASSTFDQISCLTCSTYWGQHSFDLNARYRVFRGRIVGKTRLSCLGGYMRE